MEPDRPHNSTSSELLPCTYTTGISPGLSAEVERALFHRWLHHHDISAAHHLVASHLHVVVSVAGKYHRQDLALPDLIGEGYVGLMHAIRRFDPDRGVRFIHDAMWWVRAAILEYILRQRLEIEVPPAPLRHCSAFPAAKSQPR